MAAAPPLFITIILTFMATSLIYGMIAGIVMIMRTIRRQKNPLDIVILELTKQGAMFRTEIGRKEIRSDRPNRVVTAPKFKPHGVKDNLGYNISDDDMLPSSHGRKRKALMVVTKDGLTSTLEMAVKNIDLNAEEEKLIKKIQQKYNQPGIIKLDEVPAQLSLKPILADQTSFLQDAIKDNHTLNNSDILKMRQRVMLGSMAMFGLTLMICLVLFIVFLNMGPDVAQEVRPKTMNPSTDEPRTSSGSGKDGPEAARKALPGMGGLLPG